MIQGMVSPGRMNIRNPQKQFIFLFHMMKQMSG